MRSLEGTLLDVVRCLAQRPDEVIVTQTLAPAKAFEVKVALTDYLAVLSKINSIKMLAMSLAGVPDGSIIINLVVNVTDAPSIQPVQPQRLDMRFQEPPR